MRAAVLVVVVLALAGAGAYALLRSDGPPTVPTDADLGPRERTPARAGRPEARASTAPRAEPEAVLADPAELLTMAVYEPPASWRLVLPLPPDVEPEAGALANAGPVALAGADLVALLRGLPDTLLRWESEAVRDRLLAESLSVPPAIYRVQTREGFTPLRRLDPLLRPMGLRTLLRPPVVWIGRLTPDGTPPATPATPATPAPPAPPTREEPRPAMER